MLEKGPDVKVVGNLPEDERQEQTKEESEKLRGFLFEKHLDDISPENLERFRFKEYPKNIEQVRIIEKANQETNKIRKEAGMEPYDVPERNFHIIPEDFYEEIENSLDKGSSGSMAMTVSKSQVVLLTDFCRRHPIIFANEVFHELLHLKAPLVFEKEKIKTAAKPEKEDIFEEKAYRFGFQVNSALSRDKAGKKHSHFSGLNEALIALLEKRFTKKIFANMLQEDEQIKWLSSREAEELKIKIAQQGGYKPEDIFWMSKSGDRWCRISYPHQRAVLEYIIKSISNVLPKEFKSEQDVLSVFNQSYFSGRLLPLARLIEKVFGKGSFEVLGMMTTEKESALLTLEYFKRRSIKNKTKEKQIN